MIVDRLGEGVVFKLLGDQFALLDVVASGGVEVDFLEQDEVGIETCDGGGGGVDVVGHFLLAASPGFLTAVHEEGEILAVRAKADV